MISWFYGNTESVHQIPRVRRRGLFLVGQLAWVKRYLTQPYPAELMRAYPINIRVGNFSNNDPVLIDLAAMASYLVGESPTVSGSTVTGQ